MSDIVNTAPKLPLIDYPIQYGGAQFRADKVDLFQPGTLTNTGVPGSVPTTFSSGITVGNTFDVAGARQARLYMKATGKSGTTPTLDVAVQTSPDAKVWRTLVAFTQASDTVAFGAVSSSGTTPPAITLTGTPVRPINLKIICPVGGARGTFTIQTSTDGGITYRTAVTSAATVTLYDEDGVDTGVVLNIANASANTDNVWTASTTAWQAVSSAGVDRYLRAVANVGGSSTPTYTAAVWGVVT